MCADGLDRLLKKYEALNTELLIQGASQKTIVEFEDTVEALLCLQLELS